MCRSMAAPWWIVTGIFISYRREHTAFIVDRLHHRLTEHFGVRQVDRDIENVGPGDDFGQRIDEAVAASAALLAIISDRWLVDRNPATKRAIGVPRDWVQREVGVALRRPGVLVIPVLIEGATMPGEQQLPYDIRSLAMCKAMHLSDRGWEDDIGRLLVALEEVVGASGATAALPTAAQAGPAAASAPLPDPSRTRRWFQRH